ncbi:hypothetical protein [Phocaeicola sp.]
MITENFFQLNMPYGMEKDPYTKEWMLFNRDRSPMGFCALNKAGCERYPMFAHHYYGLSDRFLRDLVDGRESLIHYDRLGKIELVYFYDIGCDPFKGGTLHARNWRMYMLILQEIGHIKVRISKALR